MQETFLGGGGPPPSPLTDVHVSVFLDRLLSVDDKDYTFEAVMLFYLSWRDPRARSQIAQTQARIDAGNYTCSSPCQSSGTVEAGGCCDEVWQPYLPMTNIKWLPQDRVLRWGFALDANPRGPGVAQWNVVHAVWYTPMDMRSFPFDRQVLSIQLEAHRFVSGTSEAGVRLVPSAAGPSLFTNKGVGDDVSGWSVISIGMTPYSFPVCKATFDRFDSPSAPSDPMPLVPLAAAEEPELKVHPERCATVMSRDYGGTGGRRPAALAAGTLSLSAPAGASDIMVAGVSVYVTVTRDWSRYIVSAMVPVMASTWLGFSAFFLGRRDLEARLGIVVALFLALAAIQIVIDGDLPSSTYLTAMQYVTVASYLVLILIATESLVICYIARYHDSVGADEAGAPHGGPSDDPGEPQEVAEAPRHHHEDDDVIIGSKGAAASGPDDASGDGAARHDGGNGRAGSDPEVGCRAPEVVKGSPSGGPAGGAGCFGRRAGGARSGPAAALAGGPQLPGGRRWRMPRLPGWLPSKVLSLVENPERANRVSHILNRWAGIIQFAAYNVSVLVIFLISVYHRKMPAP